MNASLLIIAVSILSTVFGVLGMSKATVRGRVAIDQEAEAAAHRDRRNFAIVVISGVIVCVCALVSR